MIKKSLCALEWHDRFGYVKNIVFDEKSLRQTGAKFQIVKFAPKASVGPHYHKKVNEIFYILQGKGTFKFNGQENKAARNDIFLCQPGDVHEIINTSQDELIILIFKTNENSEDIIWLPEIKT